MLKIFQNIKSLEITLSNSFTDSRLMNIMHLPQLYELGINQDRQLEKLIGNFINPNKLLKLSISITNTVGID